MVTEKLYYKDAYIKEFDATVLACYGVGGGEYEIVLDKTAFFPEAGGQSSDTGKIGDATVLSVRIENDILYHKVSSAKEVGARVFCTLDFEQRLEKMRAHTAEHILSGLLYKHYSVENVGFHLGDDLVTFDTSLPIDKAGLERVEALANLAVRENVPVRCYFPTKTQIEKIFYRSKSEIGTDLRIVEVQGYDSCACCAPHVAMTGEIGLIKIIYSERHKCGTRIYMLAGERAYDYACGLHKNAMRISALLCAPTAEIADEAQRLYEARDESERKYKEVLLRLARAFAESEEECRGNAVFYHPELDMDSLREFANLVSSKVGGLTVALTGEAGNMKYIIRSKSDDVGPIVKEANATLSGKGGGRGQMAQGSFSADYEDIRKYFFN